MGGNLYFLDNSELSLTMNGSGYRCIGYSIYVLLTCLVTNSIKLFSLIKDS
jgi:hypothetical protein